MRGVIDRRRLVFRNMWDARHSLQLALEETWDNHGVRDHRLQGLEVMLDPPKFDGPRAAIKRRIFDDFSRALASAAQDASIGFDQEGPTLRTIEAARRRLWMAGRELDRLEAAFEGNPLPKMPSWGDWEEMSELEKCFRTPEQ